MKIYAVIISYCPTQSQLLQLCEILVKDGASVIIVDNTETPYLNLSLFPEQCQIIPLGFNSGIAHAQNIGCNIALAGNAEVVVFFDQDSTLKQGFLNTLVSPLRIGTADVVSPLCIDTVSNRELPSLRINKYGLPTLLLSENASTPYEVDIIISSGTAMTREAFNIVGPFDEGFFIDLVDTEWCLRCRSKGVPIRVIPEAVMHHRIGTQAIPIGRSFLVEHSPRRCYYQLRNCFQLFRKPHVPFLFALKETYSTFTSRILLLFFVKHRWEYIKFYIHAVKDGLTAVAGPKPN